MNYHLLGHYQQWFGPTEFYSALVLIFIISNSIGLQFQADVTQIISTAASPLRCTQAIHVPKEMKNIAIIKTICNDCIAEGEAVLTTKWLHDSMGGFEIMNPTMYVNLEKFYKWKSNCNVLINLLKDLSTPWDEIFKGEKANTHSNAESMLGGLKSINDTIDKGYLIRIEDLIFAEAFSNLIEQSEYLFEQKYFLAAGVISRAVLEEKLRNLCITQGIVFSKEKPTLSDYNNELYKSKHYDKIEFKNIDFLTSIGNNAAHNQPVTSDDIKKIIDGVKGILSKYS